MANRRERPFDVRVDLAELVSDNCDFGIELARESPGRDAGLPADQPCGVPE